MSKPNEKNGVIVPYDLFMDLMSRLYCVQCDFEEKARDEKRKGMKYLPRHFMEQRKATVILRARLGNCKMGRVKIIRDCGKAWVSTAREDVR